MSDGPTAAGWALGDGPSSYNRRRRMVSKLLTHRRWLREADDARCPAPPALFPRPSAVPVFWPLFAINTGANVLTSVRARVFWAVMVCVGHMHRWGATAAARFQAKGGLLRTRC